MFSVHVTLSLYKTLKVEVFWSRNNNAKSSGLLSTDFNTLRKSRRLAVKSSPGQGLSSTFPWLSSRHQKIIALGRKDSCT